MKDELPKEVAATTPIKIEFYNGYEVKETPEDKVRQYYNRLQKSIDDNPTSAVWQAENECEKAGIVNTLDLLGINIEGVNA